MTATDTAILPEKQRWKSWEVGKDCFSQARDVLHPIGTLNTRTQSSQFRLVHKDLLPLRPSKLAPPVSHYLKAYSLFFITL